MAHGQAVKISQSVINDLRAAAAVHSRSVAGQAEYWIRLGKAVEQDPRFSHERVDAALRAELPFSSLKGPEADQFFDRWAEQDDLPDRDRDAFYASLAAQAGASGLDDDGHLIVVD